MEAVEGVEAPLAGPRRRCSGPAGEAEGAIIERKRRRRRRVSSAARRGQQLEEGSRPRLYLTVPRPPPR